MVITMKYIYFHVGKLALVQKTCFSSLPITKYKTICTIYTITTKHTDTYPHTYTYMYAQIINA